MAAASHLVGLLSLLLVKGYRHLLAHRGVIGSLNQLSVVRDREIRGKTVLLLSPKSCFLFRMTPWSTLSIFLFYFLEPSVVAGPSLTSPVLKSKNHILPPPPPEDPDRWDPHSLPAAAVRSESLEGIRNVYSYFFLVHLHLPFWAGQDRTGPRAHFQAFQISYCRHIYIWYWFLFNRISQEKSRSLLAFKG